MTANGDDSTLVDNAVPPYNNSHCLYTNAEPSHLFFSKYHDATAVDYFTPLLNDTTPLFFAGVDVYANQRICIGS